jgi:two-component sensor histidine kinase
VEAEKGSWLHLRWQERGGPPVEPPTARGFGIRLIEFAAANELEGRAELTFAPEGLVAEVVLPLS